MLAPSGEAGRQAASHCSSWVREESTAGEKCPALAQSGGGSPPSTKLAGGKAGRAPGVWSNLLFLCVVNEWWHLLGEKATSGSEFKMSRGRTTETAVLPD